MPAKKSTIEERLKKLGEEVTRNLQAEHGITQRELLRVREAAREQWEQEQKAVQSNQERHDASQKEEAAKEEIARAQREEEEKRRKQEHDREQEEGHEY